MRDFVEPFKDAICNKYANLALELISIAKEQNNSALINEREITAAGKTALGILLESYEDIVDADLILRKLIDAGADVEKPLLSSGFQVILPLHYAATEGLYNVVEILLAAGANVNSISDNKTALSLATPLNLIVKNSGDITKLLLSNGADPHLSVLQRKMFCGYWRALILDEQQYAVIRELLFEMHLESDKYNLANIVISQYSEPLWVGNRELDPTEYVSQDYTSIIQTMHKLKALLDSREVSAPRWAICPISWEIPYVPVKFVDHAQAYNREHIKEWLQHKQTNPMTNQMLTSFELQPDIEMAKRIIKYLEHLQTEPNEPQALRRTKRTTAYKKNKDDEPSSKRVCLR